MAIIRINPRLEAELTGSLNSNGPMEHALGDVASLIAAHARSIARSEFYLTGAYLTGIKAEHGLDEHGELVGRVAATDFKSHWAEFGWKRRTGGTRARHVLRRAAERAGYQVAATQLASSFLPPVGRLALPASGRGVIPGR